MRKKNPCSSNERKNVKGITERWIGGGKGRKGRRVIMNEEWRRENELRKMRWCWKEKPKRETSESQRGLLCSHNDG